MNAFISFLKRNTYLQEDFRKIFNCIQQTKKLTEAAAAYGTEERNFQKILTKKYSGLKYVLLRGAKFQAALINAGLVDNPSITVNTEVVKTPSVTVNVEVISNPPVRANVISQSPAPSSNIPAGIPIVQAPQNNSVSSPLSQMPSHTINKSDTFATSSYSLFTQGSTSAFNKKRTFSEAFNSQKEETHTSQKSQKSEESVTWDKIASDSGDLNDDLLVKYFYQRD